MNEEYKQTVLTTALLAGRIMMESGSEAYRVEDTMLRICRHAGFLNAESYVTATGIFLSLNDLTGSQLQQARRRSTNFERIANTNQLSRLYTSNAITLEELNHRLQEVDINTPNFPFWWKIICAGIASTTLMIIMGGSYYDFLAAIPIGAAGYIVSVLVSKYTGLLFINDLFASIVITFLVLLLENMGLVTDRDMLIVGTLIPLVPGLAITAAFRDLFAGHLLTGIVRSVEAIITASVLGIGIALMLSSM